jgi:hypothetical protein
MHYGSNRALYPRAAGHYSLLFTDFTVTRKSLCSLFCCKARAMRLCKPVPVGLRAPRQACHWLVVGENGVACEPESGFGPARGKPARTVARY